MIAFACPSCGKKLSVKDESAGKKAKCPGCGQTVPIPTALASSGVRDKKPAPQAATSYAEARTLPPEPGAAGRDSVSGGETQAPPGEKDASSPSPEHYDFLAPPQAPDEIGRLGPFRVLKVLGAGGMGVVFKAEDPQLGRAVAIKAMLPALAVSPSAKQRFLREARATAAIKHDHIVSIYQVGEDRNVPFLAMEFLEGEPLDARLKREDKLPPAEVLRITREVADGLAAAHERGLVHRDIKPANIWLERRGQASGVRSQAPARSALTPDSCLLTPARVKILDFGLARATADESHLTQTGAIVGTPAYMAPEQANSPNADARCDLFSLGCVVYRMCTGQQAFKGHDTISTLLAVATQEPPPVQQLNPDIPPALSELVTKLLAKDPAKRPQSAAEVVEAIQAIEAEQEQPTTVAASALKKKSTVKKPVKPAAPARKRAATGINRRWWFVGGGAAAALLLVILILVVVNPFGGDESNPVPTPPLGNQEPPRPLDLTKQGEFALQFDGKGGKNGVGPLPFEMNPSQPFTFEAYCVRAKSGHIPGGSWPFYAEFAGLSAQGNQWNFWMRTKTDGYNPTHQVPAKAIDDSETHVAGVYTGKELLLFVNGILVSQKNVQGIVPKAEGKPITLGTGYSGLLREVRISRIARYTSDFTPEQRFTADKDTLALYHFDEGQGDVLKDSSGNNHHGKIVGAKWVKADGTPLPPVVSLVERLTSPDYEWSEPENLGPGINTGVAEMLRGLTDDERIILFERNGQLMMSTRKTKEEPFPRAVLLPDAINRDATNGATMTGDGLELAFVSKREGSAGEDIWVSTRKSVDEPFGEPVRLPEPVNSPSGERHPVFSADGLTLLVTATRAGASGEIWMFRRDARDQPFGDGTRLPEPVNTPEWDVPVWISNDGLVLCTRSQGMKQSKSKLWVRSARAAPFGPALSLPPWPDEVGAGLHLSADGQRLYVNSENVPGGKGQHDIWMVRRVPKAKPGDKP